MWGYSAKFYTGRYPFQSKLPMQRLSGYVMQSSFPMNVMGVEGCATSLKNIFYRKEVSLSHTNSRTLHPFLNPWNNEHCYIANGRPMLPFDWLIHSSLILASCHRFCFCAGFLRLRNKFEKKKKKKKIQTDCEGNIFYLR